MTSVWARVVAGCSSCFPLVRVVMWILTALQLLSLVVPSLCLSSNSCINDQCKLTGLSWVRLLADFFTALQIVKCMPWWNLFSRHVNEMQPGRWVMTRSSRLEMCLVSGLGAGVAWMMLSIICVPLNASTPRSWTSHTLFQRLSMRTTLIWMQKAIGTYQIFWHPLRLIFIRAHTWISQLLALTVSSTWFKFQQRMLMLLGCCLPYWTLLGSNRSCWRVWTSFRVPFSRWRHSYSRFSVKHRRTLRS